MQLLKTSNFIGSLQHAAPLFQGQSHLLYFYVYCFHSQYCETWVCLNNNNNNNNNNNTLVIIKNRNKTNNHSNNSNKGPIQLLEQPSNVYKVVARRFSFSCQSYVQYMHVYFIFVIIKQTYFVTTRLTKLAETLNPISANALCNS